MRRRTLIAAAALCLFANALVWRQALLPRALEARVLAVGKGDAVLLRTPDGRTVLIDTGADASILRALGEALPAWQRTLDAVILTSTAPGAAGGLEDVIARYRVGIVLRPVTRGTPSREAAIAAAVSAGNAVPVRALGQGARLALGGAAYAEVLWPDSAAAAMSPSDGALALRIVYGARSALIEENLSPRAAAWLGASASLVIATNTPPGVFRLSGDAAE